MRGHLTDAELMAHRFNKDEDGKPLLSDSEANWVSSHLLDCPECLERSEALAEERLASKTPT